MKKIFLLLSILIPFLVRSQDVYLYGSTGAPNNNVIAKNDFTITSTFYLGQKDTTFTPKRSGAQVTRPQDGITYTYIRNPGGKQWWRLGGVQNIYAANMLSAINDSTFGMGGTASQNTTLNIHNAFNFTIDSAATGPGLGFRVNFNNDAGWDLFTRDSITGYWMRIPKGNVGQSLQMISGGGIGWGNQLGGSGAAANLNGTPNSTTYVVTNTNGTGFTIPAATQLAAGLYTAANKQRGDSTVYAINSHAGGDTLAYGSANKDSIIFRDIQWVQGADILIDRSASTLSSIIVKISSDTTLGNSQHLSTYGYGQRNFLPLSLSSGNIYLGNGSGVATAVVPTGDITISNTGVTAIGTSKVTNAMLAGSIAYSKLSLNGSILNADLAGSIAAAKLIGTDITTVGTISSGIWSGQLIVPSYGGTGIASYTIGDLLFASTSTVLSKLPDIATGNVLLSGGVGAAPSYGKVDLTAHVNSILPSSNGGLGAQNLTGYIYGNGSSPATASTTIPGGSVSGDISGKASNITGTIIESQQNWSDITTNNVSTSKHGLVPKLPNNNQVWLDGTGNFSAPTGSGGPTNLQQLSGVAVTLYQTLYTKNGVTVSVDGKFNAPSGAGGTVEFTVPFDLTTGQAFSTGDIVGGVVSQSTGTGSGGVEPNTSAATGHSVYVTYNGTAAGSRMVYFHYSYWLH